MVDQHVLFSRLNALDDHSLTYDAICNELGDLEEFKERVSRLLDE